MPKVKDEPTFIKIQPQYIAGMNFEYGWTEKEVQEFIESYIELKQCGSDEVKTILTLAEIFNRKDAEVAILIIDLGEGGYISRSGKGKNPRKFAIEVKGGRKPARYDNLSMVKGNYMRGKE
jgi:hypothetical protein